MPPRHARAGAGRRYRRPCHPAPSVACRENRWSRRSPQRGEGQQPDVPFVKTRHTQERERPPAPGCPDAEVAAGQPEHEPDGGRPGGSTQQYFGDQIARRSQHRGGQHGDQRSVIDEDVDAGPAPAQQFGAGRQLIPVIGIDEKMRDRRDAESPTRRRPPRPKKPRSKTNGGCAPTNSLSGRPGTEMSS